VNLPNAHAAVAPADGAGGGAAGTTMEVTYDIQYDDGDFETAQKAELIQSVPGEPRVAVVDWQCVFSVVASMILHLVVASSCAVVSFWARQASALCVVSKVVRSRLGSCGANPRRRRRGLPSHCRGACQLP
jgi:hypothetical protein